MVDEFLELVQIDACFGDERKVADALKAKLEALGFRVTEDDTGPKVGGNAGNLTGILEGSKPGALLLTSHMDRVENGYGIKPQLKDGRISSDGTTVLAADDLSGAAAILEGIRQAQEQGIAMPRLEVVFTVGEEPQLRGSKHYDFSQLKAKMGYALDSPGRIGRIINAAPSTTQLHFDVYGKPAHAGNAPEKGVNALRAAAQVLATIREGRLDEETTANFAVCNAANVTNVVCDHVYVQGETRSANHDKMEAYCEYFEKFVKETIAKTDATVETRVERVYRCFHVPEDGPSIRLAKTVFAEMDIPVRIERGGGGMDGNRFNEYGIECVGLATGYAQNHTLNEYIEVEDLIRSGEMVRRIIANFQED
ncbi:MAG: M20/M25/M40 family metallo-hydrolase [Anaerotruncus sp.]|nr:M20/M25/M40 family metallo-hydrolase [Anaerotruncus sp.]